MNQDPLKVGELAERTGLSVRTLHHYDEIGLLSPVGRTGSGHRLYGGEELTRLAQIVSLRQLGLSLDAIKFTAGNAAIEESLGQAYQQEGGPSMTARHGWSVSPEVFEWLQQAMARARAERDAS